MVAKTFGTATSKHTCKDSAITSTGANRGNAYRYSGKRKQTGLENVAKIAQRNEKITHKHAEKAKRRGCQTLPNKN